MTELTPRIYVASLSDYNDGRLHGTWIDLASITADEAWRAVQDMLARSPDGDAEEFAIHDYEGFGPYRVHEYASIDHVIEVAHGIAEHGEAFAAWATQVETREGETLECFWHAYVGTFDSMTDFAEQLLDDLGIDTDPTHWAPALIAPYVRIDIEAFASDLSMDYSVVEASGGRVHVFET